LRPVGAIAAVAKKKKNETRKPTKTKYKCSKKKPTEGGKWVGGERNGVETISQLRTVCNRHTHTHTHTHERMKKINKYWPQGIKTPMKILQPYYEVHYNCVFK